MNEKRVVSIPKIIGGLVISAVGVAIIVNMIIGINISSTTERLAQFPSIESRLSSLSSFDTVLVWKDITNSLSKHKDLPLGEAFIKMREEQATQEVELFATWALGEMKYTPALKTLNSRPGRTEEVRRETEQSIVKISKASQ